MIQNSVIPRKILIIACALGLILLVNIGMMFAGPEFIDPTQGAQMDSDNMTNESASDFNFFGKKKPLSKIVVIAIPALSLLWIVRWVAKSTRTGSVRRPQSESRDSGFGIGIIIAVSAIVLWPRIILNGFFSNLPEMSLSLHVLGLIGILVPTIGIGYLLHLLLALTREQSPDEEE